MENLKALVYGRNLNNYQKALAQREFEGLIERLKIYKQANALKTSDESVKTCHTCTRYGNAAHVVKYCSECNGFSNYKQV
jgi:hypothetical protein